MSVIMQGLKYRQSWPKNRFTNKFKHSTRKKLRTICVLIFEFMCIWYQFKETRRIYVNRKIVLTEQIDLSVSSLLYSEVCPPNAVRMTTLMCLMIWCVHRVMALLIIVDRPHPVIYMSVWQYIYILYIYI